MTAHLLSIALSAVASGPGTYHDAVVPAPVRNVAPIGDTPPDDVSPAERIADWHDDPVLFVQEVFGAEPDEWQKDALRAVAGNPRVAMSACKGPGKSCTLAWVVWWFLTTRVDSQVAVLSITADNLKDGLWKELARWHAKSKLLERAFECKAERIKSRTSPGTWFCSARSFAKTASAEEQAHSLAGLHGEHVLIVLDEVGDYPEGVIPAAEAIFANEGDHRLVVAGNPTNPNRALGTIVRSPKGWVVIHITGDPDDPKRSPRIDIEYAREMIEKWGRDHPYVMVNILGLFPPSAENQLISANDVTLAMARDMPALAYQSDPIIWGLDPARSDRSVADEAALARRQGLLARRILTWRGKDGTQLGDIIGRLINEAEDAGEKPDVIFVDVGGVGSSVYDRLRVLGYEDLVIAVDFAGTAEDSERYHNVRAEIWDRMAMWVRKRPSCLPSDSTLAAELQAPLFKFVDKGKKTKFLLESKDDMKKRGVGSPNRADSLALTFTSNVNRRGRHARALDQRTNFYEAAGRPFSL